MSPEQRGLMRETQLVMSLLEGFSDWVMDEVGEQVVPDVRTIRSRFEARRNQRRRGIDRVKVDVADAVRKQFAGTRIRFIHVEVYKDNDPAKGFNRWFRQWRLPTEPWTFLVGADGRIKAKFEGSVGRAELEAAVRQYLAR